MQPIRSTRAAYQIELHFDAPLDRVFPLLCPVREYDWIEGWNCTMVHADSGIAELGGIFQTNFPDLGEETWTISRYEPPHRIEFVRVASKKQVVFMQIQLHAVSHDKCMALVSHTFTALSPEGDKQIAARTQTDHEQEVKALEIMANHYLTTGNMLRPAPAKARAAQKPLRSPSR